MSRHWLQRPTDGDITTWVGFIASCSTSPLNTLYTAVLLRRAVTVLQCSAATYRCCPVVADKCNPMGEKYHGLIPYDILKCTFAQPTSSCIQSETPKSHFIAHSIVSLVK